MSVLRLSRGSVWKPSPNEPPYLRAPASDPWPDGAPAWTLFTNTQGATIARVDGEASPTAISFLADPEQVDLVPAGANFEVFIDTDDGPMQVRYGKVVRREASYFNSPDVLGVTQAALQFTDTFPTLGLKSSWDAVAGIAQVYDNSLSSLPNGVGPRMELLTQSRAAIRWHRPLNSRSVRVKVKLLNLSGLFSDTGSKMTVVVCADQRFTSYLGVQFVENGGKIHFCKGTSPYTMTYLGSEIDNDVANGDSHEIYFDDANDTVSVYKGTSGTPLGSYPGVSEEMPLGPGYQYTGLAWDNTPLNAGIQASYWSAKDEV
jgi:hypothetical protein